MQIILVLVSDILKFPPVINLINILEELNIETTVICTETEYVATNLKHVSINKIKIEYEGLESPLCKFIQLPQIKKIIWNQIDSVYNEQSVIWVVSNLSLKYLGNKIKKYRYVLHFLELSEDLRYYADLPFFKLDAHELCSKSLGVIVPEYNRAHILQAWWELDETPYIFSNKPYMATAIKKNEPITNVTAKNVIDIIGNKKIILYQGILDPERPLEKFVKAAEVLGNEYAFVIMSGDKDVYKYMDITNYYFIPFVSPPHHLEITSHAYIGVLSYFPTKSTSYSVLNTLYCAPNKTFEYGMFGIPMLGNNIPGLKFLFETQKCGVCFNDFTVEDICRGIKSIENNYMSYSKSAKEYFDKTNSRTELEVILDGISRKLMW